MIWFSNPVQLQGTLITLTPLEQLHFEDLILLSKDKRIWQYYAIDGSDTNKMKNSLELALTEREKGAQYPFVILKKDENKIIGSTRFLEIQPGHKKLEIGWTWLHPYYWGTTINLECKMLLLTYCFEELSCARVQLKTDENNVRSRKAIEKIGGQLEGIFRNDMIRDNGTKRNSAYYSIIDDQWIIAKEKLLNLLTLKRLPTKALT
jgi:RimJ/RimL family protein N-acetyltransferase